MAPRAALRSLHSSGLSSYHSRWNRSQKRNVPHRMKQKYAVHITVANVDQNQRCITTTRWTKAESDEEALQNVVTMLSHAREREEQRRCQDNPPLSSNVQYQAEKPGSPAFSLFSLRPLRQIPTLAGSTNSGDGITPVMTAYVRE